MLGNALVTELQKSGYLDAFVQTQFSDVGQLSYEFTVLPAGCNLAAAECNIAYLIKPTGGVAKEEVANNVLRRLGASGPINDVSHVNLARAWDGRRTMASPVPVKNALFVTRVYPASQLAAALPLDGSRPMTGDWDLGTKKLTGVGTLSTDTFRFSTTVTEGDPCTNTPGYKSLAMGSNHYIQICKGGVWVHANEDLTVVVNTVIHNPAGGGGGGGGGGSGSGGTPGWRGPDGQMYPSPTSKVGVDTPCTGSCTRNEGDTDEAGGPSDTTSEDGGACSGSCNAGGGPSGAPPGTGYGNGSEGPGSGGVGGGGQTGESGGSGSGSGSGD